MQPSALEPRADQFSTLEQERREFVSAIPAVLRSAYALESATGTPIAAGGKDVQDRIRAMFPETVGQEAVSIVPTSMDMDKSISRSN